MPAAQEPVIEWMGVAGQDDLAADPEEGAKQRLVVPFRHLVAVHPPRRGLPRLWQIWRVDVKEGVGAVVPSDDLQRGAVLEDDAAKALRGLQNELRPPPPVRRPIGDERTGIPSAQGPVAHDEPVGEHASPVHRVLRPHRSCEVLQAGRCQANRLSQLFRAVSHDGEQVIQIIVEVVVDLDGRGRFRQQDARHPAEGLHVDAVRRHESDDPRRQKLFAAKPRQGRPGDHDTTS